MFITATDFSQWNLNQLKQTAEESVCIFEISLNGLHSRMQCLLTLFIWNRWNNEKANIFISLCLQSFLLHPATSDSKPVLVRTLRLWFANVRAWKGIEKGLKLLKSKPRSCNKILFSLHAPEIKPLEGNWPRPRPLLGWISEWVRDSMMKIMKEY